jgi:hypothetical protein
MLFVLPGVARAQTCPDPRRAWEEAEALVREGYEHLRVGDYVNALEKYRLSYACVPTPEALRSIGAALRGLNRNAEAAAAFEDYLAHPKATNLDENATVERAKREALAEVGELLVVTSENGALVHVDQRELVFAILAVPAAAPATAEPAPVTQAAQAPPRSRATPLPALSVATPDKASDRAPRKPSKGLRYASLGTGGLALTALGIGAYYGFSASSTWSTAQQRCPDYTCQKVSDTSLGEDAGRAADRATASFITAGVLATGALVMYLIAD